MGKGRLTPDDRSYVVPLEAGGEIPFVMGPRGELRRPYAESALEATDAEMSNWLTHVPPPCGNEKTTETSSYMN